MKKKVVVAGHICLDITPVFPEKKVDQLSDILSPGKLIHMGAADVHTGGCVANTGLAMKLLGADVTLMCKLGKDAFGQMVMNLLEDYHVNCSVICSENEATSYSVILAVPGIDRIFLHNPGANNTFMAKDISREVLEETALFHFGYPSLMRNMYRNDGEELLNVMKCAKEAGCATSLDMASVDPNSDAGIVDWEKILEKVLPYVDFFVPSVEELCYMLDRERFIEWQKRAAGRDITEILDIETDVKPLARQCMDFGTKVLLVKCGAPGMYYRTADKLSLEQVSERIELNIDNWAAEVLLPYGPLEEVSYYLLPMAKKANVPVVIHLDHGLRKETCIQALELGFSSIMYDCSTDSYEDNVKKVKEMADIAHSYGATIEGELGHVGDNPDSAEGNFHLDDPSRFFTDPKMAKDYVDKTGVDALAIAVGNAHGAYKLPPKLDFNRIRTIAQTVDVPLVLHGGSGLTDNDFKHAIQEGISKVNIFTDINVAAVKAEFERFSSMDKGLIDLIPAAVEAVKQESMKKMKLFSSDGKAGLYGKATFGSRISMTHEEEEELTRMVAQEVLKYLQKR